MLDDKDSHEVSLKSYQKLLTQRIVLYTLLEWAQGFVSESWLSQNQGGYLRGFC